MAGSPVFTWPALAGRTAGIGLAVLASAVAALTICAVLPEPENVSTPSPVQRAGPTSAAVQRVAPQAGVALNVAKVWTDERAQLFAATHPVMPAAMANAGSSVRGVSILLGERFASAAQDATARPPLPDQTAETATAVPLPPRVPAGHLRAAKRQAVGRNKPIQLEPQVASLPPQAPEPGYLDFFRKLFGHPGDDAAKAIMAANPKTAIYDIAKHVVYLPNGDKLEAHSGYGHWMDDPQSVKRKDLGVTPPNVYAVSFRTKLFHGVRALRLTPVGKGNMYGRDGMLAHSYMLGASGQSNGCVSIKNYQKFLQAYKNGTFDELIVVPRIDDSTPARMASIAPGSV